jgi:hypothetical protein
MMSKKTFLSFYKGLASNYAPFNEMLKVIELHHSVRGKTLD